MTSITNLKEHFAQIKQVSAEFFPKASIEIIYFRYIHFSVRIELVYDLFIDIYYNANNGRQDYTLIKENRRIFGYDNLSRWHYHPVENPEQHTSCKKPTLHRIFKDIAKAVKGV